MSTVQDWTINFVLIVMEAMRMSTVPAEEPKEYRFVYESVSSHIHELILSHSPRRNQLNLNDQCLTYKF